MTFPVYDSNDRPTEFKDGLPTYVRLTRDNDMSKEATEKSANEELALMTSTVALSGAVAVFAYVSGPMLHIASCGDCVAVLGIIAELITNIFL